MAGRSARLERLLRIQHQLEATHEMRRAGLLRQAHAAGRDADDIAASKAGPGSLSDSFPGLYERSITRAVAERDRKLEAAAAEAARQAVESARADRVEADFRAALAEEERARAEREGLESVERMLAPGKR